MTSLVSNSYPGMEFLQTDDTMDMASSPYRRPDDIDLDLDQNYDLAAGPHIDSMFDEELEQDDASGHLKEAAGDSVQDDDMIDEDQTVQPADQGTHDFAMTGDQEQSAQNHHFEEDDILYEDEEDGPIPVHTEHLATTDDSQENSSATSAPPHAEKPSLPKADTYDTETKYQETYTEERLLESAQSNHKTQEDRQSANEGQSTTTSGNRHGNDSTPKDLANSDLQNKGSSDQSNYLQEGTHLDDDTAESNKDQNQDEEPTHGLDPYLHPVKVIYEDHEISMFPPTADDSSDTFFLSDASFAYEPLEKLLGACRDVLSDSIGDHDELVLDVASLGLHICEDSKYATQITLAQILDVYLTLSHNENPDQIEPLYCSLTSRVSLAAQYAYLNASAQQGRTFTDISAENLGSQDEPRLETKDVSNEQYTEEYVQEDRGYPNEDEHIPNQHTEEQQHSPDEIGELHQESKRHEDFTAGDVQTVDLIQKSSATVSEDATESNDVNRPTSQTFSPAVRDFADTAEPQPAEETTTLADGGAPVQYPKTEYTIVDDDDDDDDASAATDEVKTGQHEVLQASASETTPNDQMEAFEGEDEAHDREDELDHRDPGDLDIDELLDENGDKTDSIDEEAAGFEGGAGIEDPLERETLEDDLLDLEAEPPEEEIPNERQAVEESTAENSEIQLQEQPYEHDSSVNSNGVSTPVKVLNTPLKSKASKRKLPEEDDDLELLDLGTPDNKRRRPS